MALACTVTMSKYSVERESLSLCLCSAHLSLFLIPTFLFPHQFLSPSIFLFPPPHLSPTIFLTLSSHFLSPSLYPLSFHLFSPPLSPFRSFSLSFSLHLFPLSRFHTIFPLTFFHISRLFLFLAISFPSLLFRIYFSISFSIHLSLNYLFLPPFFTHRSLLCLSLPIALSSLFLCHLSFSHHPSSIIHQHTQLPSSPKLNPPKTANHPSRNT